MSDGEHLMCCQRMAGNAVGARLQGTGSSAFPSGDEPIRQPPSRGAYCLAMRLALFLAVLLSLPVNAAEVGPSRRASWCLAGSAQPVRDTRILAAVAQAREQHRLFGGQLMDRGGAIVKLGFHEAEFDRLPAETMPTWQRVARFWTAVAEHLPSTFRSPSGRRVSRQLLFDRVAAASAASGGAQLDEHELAAIRSALLRSALVDEPWSAVFISFLMKESGFTRDEFAFSDSHVDYVDQAFLASAAEARGEAPASAYRACDLLTTKPRPGDLICHTREGAAGIASFAALQEELDMRRSAVWANPIPMHCDLVTSADAGGNAKMETVGGNVVQSVTLRQLTLNARKTLSARYLQTGTQRSCGGPAGCRANLSRKPWVVLLQYRL